MDQIILRHITKQFADGACAVRDFNLEIEEGEFIILVGPSGCGKSTTLRMIAGLEEISSGELWMHGELMNFTEPQKRGLAMVFQNYALYPQMTIYENMAFALKIRKFSRTEINERVHEAAKLLNIEELLTRRPSELSGGQRQRVAMGRAIVRKTKAYLMDEPLSNLDAKLRAQMRVELARLHSRMKTTIIYVTHDQVEAMTLGTRIVVMNRGEVQQVAPPSELYTNPINQFVAGFIGSPSMNFLEADVLDDCGQVLLDVKGQHLHLPKTIGDQLIKKGYKEKSLILGIRPEDLSLLEEVGDVEQLCPDRYTEIKGDHLELEIEVCEFLGSEVLLHGNLEKCPVSVQAAQNCHIKGGEKALFRVNFEHIALFDRETEQNILYREKKKEEYARG